MRFVTTTEDPRFEISECGIVRNVKTKAIKSQYVSSTGYYLVSISKNNKSKPHKVHRMLAKAFIPNPNEYGCVNHIDGDKLNNNLSNLEWVNHLQNMQHAFRTGLVNNSGVRNGMAVLNDEKAAEIKRMLKEGKMSQQKIADSFGVSRGCVLKIHIGETWRHV